MFRGLDGQYARASTTWNDCLYSVKEKISLVTSENTRYAWMMSQNYDNFSCVVVVVDVVVSIGVVAPPVTILRTESINRETSVREAAI